MVKKKNTSGGDDQAGPSKKARKVDMRGEPAKRRKIEKKDQEIKKLTELRDTLIKEYEDGPIDESNTDYVAIIYGTLTESRAIYIGHHNGLDPRIHQQGTDTALDNFKSTHKDERFISTVLLYLKSNDDAYKLYMEGQIQMIYKIADIHDWTIGQLKFPFKIYSDKWPGFNIEEFQEGFKDVKIRLMNGRIETRQLDVKDVPFFLNLPQVSLGAELGFTETYKYENDPLRFVEPQSIISWYY